MLTPMCKHSICRLYEGRTAQGPFKGTPVIFKGLWGRASSAGAFTPMEKRAFGIADDIYEAGLLCAYLAFVPFCEAGIMDGLSLQRLLGSTFKLDVMATREVEKYDLEVRIRLLRLSLLGKLMKPLINDACATVKWYAVSSKAGKSFPSFM
ncbi:hypothetical protein F3Y22_tig00004041pilonHSYRG00004 [Hibiscus syriacus]|uniref:Uncharacterized protein n=1 Tax=Hibiscus syriacus TaxID=106335 RepID=A0A6A3CJL4_HIBSY|nr:hypothetical protein F3Y22_tig00004041pilonHSYRG00004 [Hibiscus syriacus]